MTLPEGTKVEGWWLKVCGLWLVVGAGAGCQRTTNNKQRPIERTLWALNKQILRSKTN